MNLYSSHILSASYISNIKITTAAPGTWNKLLAEGNLVTDGMGESQPVAPNDSPVIKALNRRVEFIKM